MVTNSILLFSPSDFACHWGLHGCIQGYVGLQSSACLMSTVFAHNTAVAPVGALGHGRGEGAWAYTTVFSGLQLFVHPCAEQVLPKLRTDFLGLIPLGHESVNLWNGNCLLEIQWGELSVEHKVTTIGSEVQDLSWKWNCVCYRSTSCTFVPSDFDNPCRKNHHGNNGIHILRISDFLNWCHTSLASVIERKTWFLKK